MADPLIGKFFAAYEESKTVGGKKGMTWNGQIRSRVKEGLYLVRLMSAIELVMLGRVSFEAQVMVAIDKMEHWVFFDSRQEWAEHYAGWSREQESESEAKRAAAKKDTAFTKSGSSPGIEAR